MSWEVINFDYKFKEWLDQFENEGPHRVFSESTLKALVEAVKFGDEETTVSIAAFGRQEIVSYLSLTKAKLGKIPESLFSLSSLTSLHLMENGLTSIPDAICQMKLLSKLRLGYNRISNFPDSIFQLTALTELGLEKNQLTEVPSSIWQLTALTKLYLSRNKLTELPSSIGRLTALTSLYLDENQLTEIPSTIGQLSTLTYSSLSDNKLTNVPSSIGQLTSLISLNLHRNRLRKVPDSIGDLTSLTKLYLYGNQLTEVPSSIGQLTALNSLNLCSNQLTEVPSSIGQLTALTKLDLSYNQLTEVPSSIGQLTTLTNLDLGVNELTEVPSSIGQLTALTELDLVINQLMSLPDSICHLSSLGRNGLSVRDNPLIHPPQSVIDEGLPAIQAYLRASLQLSESVSTPGPILLVGAGGAGKTTLKMALQVAHDASSLESVTREVRQQVSAWRKPEFQQWITEICESEEVEVSNHQVAAKGEDLLAVVTKADVKELFPAQSPPSLIVTRRLLSVAQTLREDFSSSSSSFSALTSLPHIWTEGVSLEKVGDQVIWDFAGQLEFFPAHRMHLLESGCHYVLVCDSRKSVGSHCQQLCLWLNFYRAMSAVKPVEPPALLLVMTHADVAGVSRDEVRRQAQAAMDHARQHYVGVMNLTNDPFLLDYTDNVDGGDLRRLLAHIQENAPMQKVPKVHQQLREALVSIRESKEEQKLPPLIATADFAILFAEHGVTRPDLTVALKAALTGSGDIRELDDFVILSPVSWLTRLLARLLHPQHKYMPNLDLSRGSLKREEIAHCISPDPIDVVLSLLQDYRLCVAITRECLETGKDEIEFVIPALLEAAEAQARSVVWWVPPTLSTKPIVFGRRYRVEHEKFESLAPGFISALQVLVALQRPSLLHLSAGKVIAADSHGTVFGIFALQLPISKGFDLIVWADDQQRAEAHLNLMAELVAVVWSEFPGVPLIKSTICPLCLKEAEGREEKKVQSIRIKTVKKSEKEKENEGREKKSDYLLTDSKFFSESVGKKCPSHSSLSSDELLYGVSSSILALPPTHVSPGTTLLDQIDMRRHEGFRLHTTVRGSSMGLELDAIDEMNNGHPSSFQLVPLALDDALAETVKRMFLDAMKMHLYSLITIDLVINPRLTLTYGNRLKEMTKGVKLAPASLLFHYTRPNLIPILCKDGFDTSFCKAGWFGIGLYFSQFLEYAINGYAWEMTDVYNGKGDCVLRFAQRRRRAVDESELSRVSEVLLLNGKNEEMKQVRGEEIELQISEDKKEALFNGESVLRDETGLKMFSPYYEALICQVVIGRSKKVSREEMEDKLCSESAACGGAAWHDSHITENPAGVDVEHVIPVRKKDKDNRDRSAEAQILPRFVIKFAKVDSKNEAVLLSPAGKEVKLKQVKEEKDGPFQSKISLSVLKNPSLHYGFGVAGVGSIALSMTKK